MISFKLFIEAIHKAISGASDTLAARNEELLDKYFYKDDYGNENIADNQILHPHMVEMEYPTLDSEGKVEKGRIQVPLITMAPLCAVKVEKTTLSADFDLSVVDNEVQISFLNGKRSKDGNYCGKLEIVISQQDPPEGLDLLVNAYNNILKRQLS